MIIAKLEKNRSEVVHVTLQKFNGHDLVDIRVFALCGESDEPRATKKGISLKVEKLAELIEALRTAKDQAVRAGLLE